MRPDFTSFFDAEHARLFRALYFVTGNRSDTEELVQEAFLKLWERWDRFDDGDDPTGYLFRVAMNGFRMRARSSRRAAKRLITMTPPSDPFEEVDIREDVRRLLLGLTPRQRAALVLLDQYDYGSPEAANILGVRPSTVRALASQARLALRIEGGPDA